MRSRSAHTIGAVRLGAEVVASSYRYDNAENTRRLAGYGILNLTAEWDVAKGWTVFARANNVFDHGLPARRRLLDGRRDAVRGAALAAVMRALGAGRSPPALLAAVVAAAAISVTDDEGATVTLARRRGGS